MAVAAIAPPVGLATPAPVHRRGLIRSLPLKAKVGGAILAFYILMAIIGPTIAPDNPSTQTATVLGATAPSLHHLLGTTSFGEDVLSQLLVGMGSTVLLGLLVGAIATVVGTLVGTTAGYLGGAADEGLSLLANVFLVLPALPLLIIVLAESGSRSGLVAEAIVLSALGWAWGARVIRAQTLTLRSRDFVAAARESGERTWRIILFEILPNEVSLIAASFVGTVLYAILTSVVLAFIGVVSLTTWSLGTMLYWAQSQEAVTLGDWWWWIPPGAAAATLGMALVLLNFGLDELGNPRLRDTGRRKIRGRAWRPSDPPPVVREGVA